MSYPEKWRKFALGKICPRATFFWSPGHFFFVPGLLKPPCRHATVSLADHGSFIRRPLMPMRAGAPLVRFMLAARL